MLTLCGFPASNYPQAFFGATVSEETHSQVASALRRGAKAIARVMRFEPFAVGQQFSYADCTALVHLPTVSEASKVVLGEDLLADAGPLRDYLARVGQRPHVMRVKADRKAGMEAFLAYRTRIASAAPQARAMGAA